MPECAGVPARAAAATARSRAGALMSHRASEAAYYSFLLPGLAPNLPLGDFDLTGVPHLPIQLPGVVDIPFVPCPIRTVRQDPIIVLIRR